MPALKNKLLLKRCRNLWHEKRLWVWIYDHRALYKSDYNINVYYYYEKM